MGTTDSDFSPVRTAGAMRFPVCPAIRISPHFLSQIMAAAGVPAFGIIISGKNN
jgi:hypothetical protein